MTLKNLYENTPEKLPSQEEVKTIFETFLEGKKYKELQVKTDEKGISVYEIEVTLENGEKIEFNYQKATYDYRDKTLPAGAQFAASIHTIYYGVDGIPYDGKCVANYLDGTWEYPS